MYDSDTSTVTSALKSSSTAVFSDDTISRILSLTTKDNATVRFDTASPDVYGNVTVGAGAEVVLVNSSDTTQTTLTPPASAPVLVFQGKGGVNVSFNDTVSPPQKPGVTDRVVVGSAGADKIVILDNKNTHVTIGAGDTVIGGYGNDTVVAGLGNSTVIGGNHTIVQMKGNESDYTVTVDNGHAVVKNSNSNTVTDISKVQYVQLDNGQALVFAKDTNQAAVATLYQTAFGRTADADGLAYWFEKAAAGVSLADIAAAFSSASENQTSALGNTDFVNSLYYNTFGRMGDSAGVDYWVNALEHGGATRAQLIKAFSEVAAHSLDGGVHTEATVVGSVTIVHNIV